MVLYGNERKSRNIRLERKKDALQTRHYDQFKAEIDDVGIPFKLRVSIDDKTYKNPWHLDRVIIRKKV